MLFIGIDPGRHGAIAVITASRDIVLLENLPWFEDGRHDPHALSDFLNGLPENLFFSVLENSSARVPNARSLMMLGKSFGSVASVLDLRSETLLTPYPSAWKAELGVTAEKSSSVLLARELFNGLPARLRADQAEALLLAEFGRARNLGRSIQQGALAA